MNISLKEAKQQADRLTARLKELGVAIKRTQALEAIAAVHNHTDWNRFQAGLSDTPATEHSCGLPEFLNDLQGLGVSLGSMAELQNLLAASENWKHDLLLAVMAPSTPAARLYAFCPEVEFCPESESAFFDPITKLMIDKYGFTSNEATNFYSQIIFVARPATFLDDLTQLGFEITERSKLLDILQGFGPLWGDKSHLIYVLRTCRKQGITFSTDSVDLRELHAKLSKYRGVPRDLAQQFLAASSVQIRNHAA